ncbi:hypothetical protein ACTUVN_002371 [Pseudomonas caspiana]
MSLQKIEDLTRDELDSYVMDQSVSIIQAAGLEMPREIGEDFMVNMEDVGNYRFDVLEAVFQCLCFAVKYRRYDAEVNTAFTEILGDLAGLEEQQRKYLTDHCLNVAEDASLGFLANNVQVRH